MPTNPATLEAVDKTRISKVDSEVVGDIALSLRRFVGAGRWVGKGNRYGVRGAAEKIAREVKSGGVKDQRQLGQYIVASCALHCSDGWGYLGRAISATIVGDSRRALHLGYYAELRAALSILASAGIGVFNTKHFVISGPGKVTKLKYGRGTHEFVWLALKHWSSLPRSGALFSEIVRPGGIGLDNWLQTIGGSKAVAPQVRRWFLQWGMDIFSLTEDRNARNENSYRPDGIPETVAISCADGLNFVRRFWEAFEPASSSRFGEIDRSILRVALERAYTGRTGQTPSPTSPAYRRFIARAVDQQGYSGQLRSEWIAFLLRQSTSQDVEPIRLSSEDADSDMGVLAVISRAALLLRMASGASSSLLRTVEPDWKRYAFWYDLLGEQRGLWIGKWEGGSFTDLWADVSVTLDDLAVYQDAHLPQTQNSIGVSSVVPNLAGVMGTYERVALWSLLDN
ncbi:MAG TPA: hypothetical protein VGI95_00030 [Caulobacteraceae bacterium]|jgi:hypothetical protein